MSLQPTTPQDDTLDLTIRFSLPIPDLFLSVPSTNNPNTSTLKQLIRDHLPSDYAKRRLRLISAGKALADDTPLSTSLRLPPSRTPTPLPHDASSTAKGKTPIRPSSTTRIYIHCSIGDLTLTSSELTSESTLAHSSTSYKTTPPTTQLADANTPSTPAPRGFDRLLTSGFTATEISSLRLQFLSIQSHTHTPDTMPSPSTLRNLEDAWLDNSSSTNLSLSDDVIGSATASGGGFGEDERGALDDMLWGTAMGFFWPVGCLMWGVREEGIWSLRRRMAVVVGVILNLGLGIVRYTR